MDGSEDKEYLAMVSRDVNGRSTDEEAASLRMDMASAKDWRDALVKILQENQAKFSAMAASVEERRQECIAAGPRTKDRFYAFEAGVRAERAKLNHWNAKVLDRLREAKAIIQQEGQDENDDKAATWHNRDRRMLELLERIAAKLGA